MKNKGRIQWHAHSNLELILGYGNYHLCDLLREFAKDSNPAICQENDRTPHVRDTILREIQGKTCKYQR